MTNSCLKAILFVGVVQCIYSLSPLLQKRKKKKKRKIIQDNPSLSLKQLSQTCWENQVESVKAIRYQAKKIRDSLLQLAKVSEDRPKIKQ